MQALNGRVSKGYRFSTRLFASSNDPWSSYFDSGSSARPKPPPPPTRSFSRDDKFSRNTNNGWGSSANGRNAMRDDYKSFDIRSISWKDENLVTFTKDFYAPHPEVEKMSSDQIASVLKEMNTTIQGKAPFPKPILKFEQAGLPEYIKQIWYKQGFSDPTSIQSVGWPIAMSGRDMIGIAQTGSGKTLGFMLPALLHIAAQPPLRKGDGPIVLVLAPTRELAVQIAKDAETYGNPGGVSTVACFGGVARGGQMAGLREGAEIVVATPGRLLDFLQSGVTNLKRCTYLVLDEADRMLDMGFERDIRSIVSQIRPDRQTLLWSATWPEEIRKLAMDFCTQNPLKVTVGSSELQANPDVTQHVKICRPHDKKQELMSLLRSECQNKDSKVLIFCNSKRNADAISRDLTYNGYRAMSLHGDKDQRDRDQILNDFKNGRVQILVATDVAQRGLDVKNIEWVVNFELPKTIEDYIHRIGRTGRAGAKGNSLTLFDEDPHGPMGRALAQVIITVGQTPPAELHGGGVGGSKSNLLREQFQSRKY